MRSLAALGLTLVGLIAGCPGPEASNVTKTEETPTNTKVTEAFCNKLIQCESGSEAETVEQCTEVQDKSLDSARAKSVCAPTVAIHEDYLSCMAELSCAELAKAQTSMQRVLEVLSRGGEVLLDPCLAELFDQASEVAQASGRETASECGVLIALNVVPWADFRGASGAACQEDGECEVASSDGSSFKADCFLGNCMTESDFQQFFEMARAAVPPQ
ncbi:hypothetical protein [Polyangium aurulentum]|uniref:hypothetical protein n=1 Tax=Polyangium aurulentum TaxID=2567896 RepID=UPI0010AE9F47|nr:hypothetical protein [Polyangium aurulentum]UQA63076.1 hypothetical protein E8A73_022485 [Polyangium aurulentum]